MAYNALISDSQPESYKNAKNQLTNHKPIKVKKGAAVENSRASNGYTLFMIIPLILTLYSSIPIACIYAKVGTCTTDEIPTPMSES